MPHSLVLNLVPETVIPLGFTTGKHLHALFLTLVSTVDPELGNQLHANQPHKPFTLSPLQLASPQIDHRHHQSKPLRWQHQAAIAPGTPCWWRITLLDDQLFNRLMPLWLQLNPQQPWHLGPANLRITSLLGTPQSTQPWANGCDYSSLYTQASSTERRITLQFCTPTTFRQQRYDTALPTPELVLGSLLRRWNHHSGMTWTQAIYAGVQPSAFAIQTEIAGDPRQAFQETGAVLDASQNLIGCVGTVTYQILGQVTPTVIQQINALADYALYAGVGRKTPMGMGMTRRLPLRWINSPAAGATERPKTVRSKTRTSVIHQTEEVV